MGIKLIKVGNKSNSYFGVIPSFGEKLIVENRQVEKLVDKKSDKAFKSGEGFSSGVRISKNSTDIHSSSSIQIPENLEIEISVSKDNSADVTMLNSASVSTNVTKINSKIGIGPEVPLEPRISGSTADRVIKRIGTPLEIV